MGGGFVKAHNPRNSPMPLIRMAYKEDGEKARQEIHADKTGKT
jgi:hypothetical protein